MAEPISIQQLTATKQVAPLEVRFIRKWLLYKNRKLCTYLLIDKKGDTIHGLFKQQYEEALDAMIKVMGCYILDDYECGTQPSLFRVSNNPISIELDKDTSVTEIPDNSSIPRVYFNFTPYVRLQYRTSAIDYLTDFIGKVEDVEYFETHGENNLLKITLKDISGEPVIAALWKEINSTIDMAALTATDHVVIVALCSAKIVLRKGSIQVELLAATRVEIDPANEEAEAIRRAFPHQPNILAAPRIRINQQGHISFSLSTQCSQPDCNGLGLKWEISTDWVNSVYWVVKDVIGKVAMYLCLLGSEEWP